MWSTSQCAKDSMVMLALNEIADQLTMVNNALWYGHALRRNIGMY